MLESVRTSVLVGWDRIDEIAPEWDRLARSIPSSSPFDTALLTLGLAPRDQNAPMPLVVTARDRGGGLTGVLPLGLAKHPIGITRQLLVPLAEWHAGTFDAVAANSEIATRMWRAVEEHGGWDAADLRYLEPDSLLAYLFRDKTTEHSILKSVEFDPVSGHQSPYHLARLVRKMRRQGKLSFDHAVDVARNPELVEQFAEWHTRRWHQESDAAEFATRDQCQRLLQVLTEAGAARMTRVGMLALDDQLLAVHLAFRWGDSQYSWRMANDTAMSEFSPGMVLLDLVLDAAAREGCRRAVLGRGGEDYKERWHPVTRPLLRAVVPGPGWRGRLLELRGRLTGPSRT